MRTFGTKVMMLYLEVRTCSPVSAERSDVHDTDLIARVVPCIGWHLVVLPRHVLLCRLARCQRLCALLGWLPCRVWQRDADEDPSRQEWRSLWLKDGEHVEIAHCRKNRPSENRDERA